MYGVEKTDLKELTRRYEIGLVVLEEAVSFLFKMQGKKTKYTVQQLADHICENIEEKIKNVGMDTKANDNERTVVRTILQRASEI